jgi:hypothetical protein
VALVSALIALAIIPINFGVWVLAVSRGGTGTLIVLFSLLALGQLVCGLVALVAGVRARFVTGRGLGPAVAGGLAALGAPAELMEWSHRAALEEIEHTRVCFALAAGYAGRSYTVQPMPELLDGGLDLEGNPLEVLASESLGDGCQLEDFNADVAAECAEACEEPATRGVLERIAREERTHADFSWALVAWLLQRDRARVQPALEKALANLERYRRPTAVSWDKRALVARADHRSLRAHGRLPDVRWGELWDQRLVQTCRRTRSLLSLARAS